MTDRIKALIPQNIREVYFEYGGVMALLKSAYFWVAVFLTACCWRILLTGGDDWTNIAISISPTLAGFSLAMFALMFAILDPVTRSLLRAPSKELGGRSPLLSVAAKIIHAVLVQLSSIVMAIIYLAKPISLPEDYLGFIFWGNLIFSFSGLLLVIYGIMLVFAAVLSVFTLFVLSE